MTEEKHEEVETNDHEKESVDGDQEPSTEEGQDDEEGNLSSWLVRALIVFFALGATSVIVVKLFGETTHEKFEAANSAVTSNMNFGGSADSVGAPSPTYEGSSAQGSSRSTRTRSRKKKSKNAGPVIVTGDSNDSESSGSSLDDITVAKEAPGDRALARKPEQSASERRTKRINPMTETSEDRFSTFAVDVDTGSYTMARNALNNNALPHPDNVRVEEFVNYFDYQYPSPEGVFGVSIEAAPSPFTADKTHKLLRVGVQGRRVPASERKPVHLVFLVDTSGSMNGPTRLELAKKSLEILTHSLREGDTVALATYSGSTRRVLEPTGIDDKQEIIGAIRSLGTGGGTSMNSGMELAYKMALENNAKGHVNRVLVLSDGDANIGPSTHSEILESVRNYVEDGVTLSTIGFGTGNYQDHLMERLANNGNGNYYYIDSEEEARRVFGEQVDGTLEVIAKDVKIQVEFDPEVVERYRLIGYENRDIADRDFRNDRVDAGEIGSGHSVTALYEIEVDPEATAEKVAVVRVRHKEPRGTKASESAFTLRRSEMHDSLSDASRHFQFAAATAMFAELLRGSPYASDLDIGLVEEVARGASDEAERDRQELLALIGRAKPLLTK